MIVGTTKEGSNREPENTGTDPLRGRNERSFRKLDQLFPTGNFSDETTGAHRFAAFDQPAFKLHPDPLSLRNRKSSAWR